MNSPLTPNFSNLILRALPAAELKQLLPHLELVELRQGEVIYRTGEPIKYVYFPENCLVSVKTIFRNGTAVESGLIACEGAVGTCLALSRAVSQRQSFVQTSGSAYRIAAAKFSVLAQKDSMLNRMILRYAFNYIEQAAQIGACNCAHTVGTRLVRLLLLCSDRMGTGMLPLTQEDMAQILGVNRPSVSVYAKRYKDEGLIGYERGTLHIADRARFEKQACECYGIIKAAYEEYIAHLGAGSG